MYRNIAPGTLITWLLLAGCPTSSDESPTDRDDNTDDTDNPGDTDTGEPGDTDTGSPGDTGDTGEPEPVEFEMRVLATDLDNPFEIIAGPGDTLWVTERTGRKVTRISMVDGTETTLLVIDEVLITEGTQDGLLGMALSPVVLGGGSGEVYLAYTYVHTSGRKVKIVRYNYDAASDTLVDPVELISGLPGSNDHNSGRVVFGPDGKLYYTIGDQGKNQFDNACRPIEAQTLPTQQQVDAGDWSAYQGKVLRLELDGSIPADNPVIEGVQSHIWSYGHRNAQGLVFASDGTLYLTDHGPKSDDELNRIEPGRNYGWPHVAGFQDDQAYVYGNWSASVEPPCNELEFSDFTIPASVPQQEESAWSHPDFQEPLMTFYTVPDDHDFQDPACADNGLYFLCWPTIAPSSLTWVPELSASIEGLQDSLLITSLKLGTLLQVSLDAQGQPTGDEATVLFTSVDRLRDTALASDGSKLYLATDSGGYLLGPDGPTDVLAHPGAILELTPKQQP